MDHQIEPGVNFVTMNDDQDTPGEEACRKRVGWRARGGIAAITRLFRRRGPMTIPVTDHACLPVERGEHPDVCRAGSAGSVNVERVARLPADQRERMMPFE